MKGYAKYLQEQMTDLPILVPGVFFAFKRDDKWEECRFYFDGTPEGPKFELSFQYNGVRFTDEQLENFHGVKVQPGDSVIIPGCGIVELKPSPEGVMHISKES